MTSHASTRKLAAVLAGATLIAASPSPANDTAIPNEKPPAATAAGVLPEGLHGFSGHLSGRLVNKDVEKGSLVMHVYKVLNVWKGNKAAKPEAAKGRTLTVTGIHGPALDVLVVLQPGDFFEIETKHMRGDDMVYLGEGIKKVAPPADSERAATPARREVMHGFRGMFIGQLMAKDQERGTLSVKIERISKTWKQNKATNAEAAVNQIWKINGVAGRWLDVLLTLEVGDRVEVEAFHRRGDELDFVGEWLKKAE